MAAGDKTNSTEKLLDIIRGKGKGGAAAPEAEAAPPTAQAAAPAASPPAAAPAGEAGAKSAKSDKAAKGDKGAKGAKAPKKAAVQKAAPARSRKAAKGGGAGTVVGVDIGPDSLRIAKINQSGGRARLVGVTRVPYGPNDNPEDPQFAKFLAGELKKFAGSAKGYDCWSLISSAKAELWHITIPKVARGQIQEAVYWSVKKEKQFDEREYVMDFEVQGEVMDKGQPKLSIMVYLAPRKQVDDLKAMFGRAGIKLTGATISPIAIQSLFRSRWIDSGANTYAHLYVGRNWSRIDIFIGDNIVLSRGIKAGTNSMVEALMENYNMMDRGGAEISMPGDSVINLQLDDETEIAPDLGTPKVLSMEQAKKVLRAKLLGQQLPSSEAGAELSEQDVLRMIRPAVERLVRQVERTFEYHTTTMGKERVEKIFFSGEICTNQLLIDFIQSQLGISYQLLDPLAPGGPGGSAAAALTPNERLDYNLVVALGLSNNTITPNLLFTFRDKEKERQLKRVDMFMFVGFLGVVALLAGFFFWQQTVIGSKKAELDKHKAELAQFVPQASEEMLMEWARKVNEKKMRLKRATKIYESIGAMKELSDLTPSEIRIVSVDLEYGSDIAELDQRRGGRRSTEKREPRTMILDGVVISQPQDYELILTSFLIRLENSGLFGLPIIQKRVEEDFSTSGNVLRFTVHVKLN